ncbi:MAG: cysteine hydrolase [Deltaproteobacteria bacterium]|nr:cysteine hydrolase [Deltaproteobacteria bacterium]
MDVPFLRTLEEKVAPGNAALIVVDVQNDFCADKGYFAKTGHDVSMAQAMVPNLQPLIEGARRAGVMVLFVQAIYDPVYLAPPWYERNARNKLEMPRCLTGTWGADFYQVSPLPTETIVRKHRYSAFINTELDLILRSRQIKTVIMTGVATNVCVESTARDAFMKDYYVVFVDDCSATYSKELHEGTLKNIEACFGIVTTSREILGAWEKLGRA